MLILEGVYTYEMKRVQVEEENSRRLKITVNYWWLILMQIIHSPENFPKAMSHGKISKKKKKNVSLSCSHAKKQETSRK